MANHHYFAQINVDTNIDDRAHVQLGVQHSEGTDEPSGPELVLTANMCGDLAFALNEAVRALES